MVFDLDGTLVDSRRDLAESANTVIAAAGGQPHSEAAIGRMVGDGAATLIARAFAAAGLPKPDDALEQFLAVYDARLLRHTRCYDGVLPLLDALAPRVTLAVLTNKPLAATTEILDGLELAGYFGARVLGGDGPHPRKPEPFGLQALIADAGVPASRTLMVGDSVIDWRTAQAAGAVGCLARYGFGADGFPVAEIRPGHRVIDRPLDLLACL